jgi:GntP family gluconate:H+ symporter
VDSLRVDPGLSMFWGIAAGILPCLVGFGVVKWIDTRIEVPLREVPGTTFAELKAIAGKPENELPSFVASAAPVLLPIVLIGLGSLLKVAAGYPQAVEFLGGPGVFGAVTKVLVLAGNKNIALLAGALIAMSVLARQRGLGWSRLGELLDAPLNTAAVIVMITAAGGAFGAMLRHAGVGDAIKTIAATYSLDLVLLSWITALVIRIAQGSATVSMLTTSAVVWPMMDPATNPPLPFNAMYVFLAIGFGSFGLSWMNDSGFWVVSKLGGLTERETLKSWTVLLLALSVAGLIFTLIASRLLPLV